MIDRIEKLVELIKKNPSRIATEVSKLRRENDDPYKKKIIRLLSSLIEVVQEDIKSPVEEKVKVIQKIKDEM